MQSFALRKKCTPDNSAGNFQTSCDNNKDRHYAVLADIIETEVTMLNNSIDRAVDDSKHLFITSLYEASKKSLVRFLSTKLENVHDAVEIANEAYLKLYLKHDSEYLENAEGYLFQIASNLAIDHLRKQGRCKMHEHVDVSSNIVADELVDHRPSPEQSLATKQQLDLIFKIAGELSAKCQKVFVLHRGQGMTYDEIAREVDISVSMVEKYMIKALKHFRKRVVKQGSQYQERVLVDNE